MYIIFTLQSVYLKIHGSVNDGSDFCCSVICLGALGFSCQVGPLNEVAWLRKNERKKERTKKKEVHQEVIVECAKQVAKPPRSQAGYTGGPVIHINSWFIKLKFILHSAFKL